MSMYDHKLVIDQYAGLLKSNDEINNKLVTKILSKIKGLKDMGYFRIIDIGCGLSPLLPILLSQLSAGRDPEDVKIFYMGVDTSKEMIENAKKIHHHHNSKNIKIQHIVADCKGLVHMAEFPWYNICIVQNYVHLILNKSDLTDLMKFVSKILANNGVFYISTKTTVDVKEHIEDDVYLIRKINNNNDICYLRRIFTDESFDKLIVDTFRCEDTYDLDVFHEQDGGQNDFINVIGHKDTYRLYDKYRYIIGYDERLKGLKSIIARCRDVKEYVSDLQTLNVIRKEGCLMSLYASDHQTFLELMNTIKSIMTQVLPGRCPIYMKDKLNMNQIGWKFQLHQDASAGWINKMKYNQFITIGIPMGDVTEYSQGPTRIGIRQGYVPKIVSQTRSDNTIDEDLYNTDHQKTLQYLNCFGVEGSYYLFDQYVLHDSNFNLKHQNRDVLFITCAVSDDQDDPEFDSMKTAELFYQQKSVMDKRQIIELMGKGYTVDDFVIDTFGKVSVRSKI